jgi:hypothetical protein
MLTLSYYSQRQHARSFDCAQDDVLLETFLLSYHPHLLPNA